MQCTAMMTYNYNMVTMSTVGQLTVQDLFRCGHQFLELELVELEPVHPLHQPRPHLYWSRGDELQQRQS